AAEDPGQHASHRKLLCVCSRRQLRGSVGAVRSRADSTLTRGHRPSLAARLSRLGRPTGQNFFADFRGATISWTARVAPGTTEAVYPTRQEGRLPCPWKTPSAS